MRPVRRALLRSLLVLLLLSSLALTFFSPWDGIADVVDTPPWPSDTAEERRGRTHPYSVAGAQDLEKSESQKTFESVVEKDGREHSLRGGRRRKRNFSPNSNLSEAVASPFLNLEGARNVKGPINYQAQASNSLNSNETGRQQYPYKEQNT